jgi:uncharacterized membrane protein (TIGR02234 family)
VTSLPSARSTGDNPCETPREDAGDGDGGGSLRNTSRTASPDAARGTGEDTAPTAGEDTPQVTGQDAAAAARSRAARRALALALLFGALGAAFALVASGQVWSHSTASFASSHLPVRATGSEVTGLPSALGLVGLAALVAVFAVRRAARALVAALLSLCGAGTLLSAVLNGGDAGPLNAKAAKLSGIAQSGIDEVHVSAWPYLSAVGGLLLLCAGLLALRYGRGWPSMSGSGRYERGGRKPRGAPMAVDPDRPEDLWKALDRGEDPTHGAA